VRLCRNSEGFVTFAHHSKIRIIKPPLIVQLDESAISIGDARAEGSTGNRAEPALETAAVKVRRDRQLPVSVGHERSGRGCSLA
jgi:hypothetical protein